MNLASSNTSIWRSESLKKTKNIHLIGVLWPSKTTFHLEQTEEMFHKLNLSCDILRTQHWPSSRSNHQTSSGMCSGTLCRAQRGKFRLIFWSLMWVPFHKFTVLHAFTISFIYATSSGSRSAGTLLLIRIILLLFFVNTAEWNIQLHPLFPNTWVHDFPRRIQSVIHTTAKRHVNHDHITSLLNLNVTLFLPLADGPRELSNYQ